MLPDSQKIYPENLSISEPKVERYIDYNNLKKKTTNMFGYTPQQFLKKAANNRPPETNDIEHGERPKASEQANTEAETNQLNIEGTQVDLENNKEANISDANLDKQALKDNSGQGDTRIKGDEDLGWFATMKEKIKNNVKNAAMDKMSETMGGKNEKSGDEGTPPLESNTAPGENRPGQQELPQPDKNRPKPGVPQTEGILTNPGSMETPVTGGVEIPQASIPGSNFKMPSLGRVVPKMPRIG